MKPRLKPIDQQVVVVFGASSGIGRCAALKFAAEGAKVVVAARTESGLRSLQDEIHRLNGQCLALVADAADAAQVKSVAARAIDHFGRIDTWVHVAGVYLVAAFEETTPEEFRRVIDINLNGQAYGAMAALPHLRNAGGGALIHISSVEAEVSLPLQSAYAASKHGIQGFVDTLRIELEKEGVPISVTNIMPASINTPLFSKALSKTGRKPMAPRPFYPPEAVADAILYCAAHPVREMIVGGAGKVFVLTKKISTHLHDFLMRKIVWPQTQTEEPRSGDAPNSVDGTAVDNRIHGDFTNIERRTSFYTRAQMRPGLLLTALSAGLAVAAAVVGRRVRRRRPQAPAPARRPQEKGIDWNNLVEV